MNKYIKQGIQASMGALALAVTACSQEELKPPSNDTAVPSESSQQLVENDTNASKGSKTQDQQISNAVADLAARLNIGADVITIKEARAVQWGSGAMGCPKPGMNYTQALVPGMRLLLEADGTIYYYHGSRQASLFYCPAERAQAPAYGQGLEVM
jgi:hypothetical protein